MRVFCIGAGYVGGPTMAVAAFKCPDVEFIVMDIFKPRIDEWNSDRLPIFEPGLRDIVMQTRGRNLFFLTADEAMGKMAESDIIFVSVNTPTKTYGLGAGRACDVSHLESCARMVARNVRPPCFKVIVEKSTVPVAACTTIDAILRASAPEGADFEVLSNPEFLAEGTAVQDLLKPDRVLIGGRPTPRGQAAVLQLVELYSRWVPRERILTTNTWSSELSKLVANAFLAQRISSINAVSALCERTGADVDEVARACGMDARIGSQFLRASVGFGGSCFQKDVMSLAYICEKNGLPEAAEYWLQILSINDWQRRRFARKVIQTMFDSVRNKKIAILGYAFKKNTGDTRESSSIYICAMLLQDRAKLSIYDPKVRPEDIFTTLEEQRETMGKDVNLHESVTICPDAYTAADGAHAVIVLTEWDEFRELDYDRIFRSMVKPAFLFDGRRLLRHRQLQEIGFHVHVIGSKSSQDLAS